jgi:hypothetical protein
MKTLGMKVENIGFLIDRLGRDCAPDQYLRELTQNAIEAIIRTGRPDGRIVWDFVEHNGVRKLCICDNGVGMAGDELVRYINSLSSSGSVQGMDSNYGVGAKIAAATRNPEGLVYLSWQDAVGSGIQLVKDGSGQYGLLQFPDFRHVFDADKGVLTSDGRKVIGDSGTCVILLGSEPNEDTAIGPIAQWIRKYLNTRYFVIPKNITIQCKTVGRTDTGLRPVNGQKWMLDAASMHKGKVELDTAVAHWWILPDAKHKFDTPIGVEGGKDISSMETFSTAYLHRGHTALLWKSELFDVHTGNSGYHRLQQFGIFLGVDRVVLYLEPTLGAITTNTARTELILDEGKPPWLDWADEFKARMPNELREFIDSIDLKVDRKNDDEAIREKIAAVMDLFHVPKYRRSKSGEHALDDIDFTQPPSPSGNATGQGSHTNGGKKNPQPFFSGPRLNGPTAKKVTVNDLPRTIFKYLENGSRAEGEMEDKAASYIETKADKTLSINGDFRVFQAIIDRYTKQYPNAAGVRQKVQEIAEKWIKLTLCEVIIGAKALQSEHWSPQIIEECLTEQALTMAVMPRVLLNQAMKREIYAALGKPTEGVVADASDA